MFIADIFDLVFVDFCSGGQEKSPDGTVKAILTRYGITESSFRYELIDSVLRVSVHIMYIESFLAFAHRDVNQKITIQSSKLI